jgi:drug/metabolite transporter (DMT)-like permease
MSVPYGESVMTSTEMAGGGAAAAAVSRRPVLTAALGAACISSSAIMVTLSGADAVTTAFFRCALALPGLTPLAIWEQRRLGRRPPGSRVAAVAAGLFLAVDLVLWNHAIADVGAGIATVLGNLQVVFVAGVAWLILRERPHRRLLVMLPVVLAGVVLVSGMVRCPICDSGAHSSGLQPAAGIGFGIATSAAYACYLLILRTSAGHSPHIAGQLADATAGAVVGSLALGLALGGLHLDLAWSSLRWLVVLALVSQTAGWLLITASLPRLPAAMSSLLLLLQPVAALVLADVVLGERPAVVQVAGAALVCLGVLVGTKGSSAPTPQRADPRLHDSRSSDAVSACSASP